MTPHRRYSSDPAPNQISQRQDGMSRVRGADLCWTSEGHGPLVVWLHGMAADRWSLENVGLYDWSPVISSGHRLVRFDARGHGRSSGRAVAEDYRWSNLADDLLALLDELAPEQPVALMGCSSGTAIALIAALRAPHRVSALVLTAPPTAWHTRAAQAALYEQGARLAERRGARALERSMNAQPRRGLFRDLPGLTTRMYCPDKLLPSVLRGGARNDLPPLDVVAGLAVPTLILSWRDDPAHPVSTGALLTDAIADSRFHVANDVAELHTWGYRAAHFLAVRADHQVAPASADPT